MTGVYEPVIIAVVVLKYRVLHCSSETKDK